MSSSYRDLIAWQRAMELAKNIWGLSATFPREELYVLVSQMRRAALSVPSNIAEGQGRASPNEFVHFLSNARGSLIELETQIQFASMLGYLNSSSSDELLNSSAEVLRLINGLMGAISQRTGKGADRKRQQTLET